MGRMDARSFSFYFPLAMGATLALLAFSIITWITPVVIVAAAVAAISVLVVAGVYAW